MIKQWREHDGIILQTVAVTYISQLFYPFRAYKTIVEDDLKFPLIYGEGKKVRDTETKCVALNNPNPLQLQQYLGLLVRLCYLLNSFVFMKPAKHFHRDLRLMIPHKWVFLFDCVRLCRRAQARVMATIGVTRGLGDHELKVYNSNIYIKPFLSCAPEVSGRRRLTEEPATLEMIT